MKSILSLTACAILVSGCASIGTVNGVPVNQPVTTSSQGALPYCQVNPVVCIVGGAIGVGVLGYVVNQTSGEESCSGGGCHPGVV